MKRPVFGIDVPPDKKWFYKPALAQEHSETSREAAAKIEPGRSRLQTLVYQAIQSKGGLTAQEVEEITGLDGNSVRPRIVELVEQNRIIDSGAVRLTKAGRRAVIWVIA